MKLTTQISNDVKQILDREMPAEKLAEIVGVTPATVYRWRDRKVRTIRADHANALNSFLNREVMKESFPVAIRKPANKIQELFDSISRAFHELSEIMPIPTAA